MTISTAPKIYRFHVEPKHVGPMLRHFPADVALAHAHLGVPPYHRSNDHAATVHYINECEKEGVLPFTRCTLMPDLSRNILLPEPEPIKFRTLNDRCPINRDLQTRINHALMKGGKFNEARFTLDPLHWTPDQLKFCWKMYQDAVKCWLDQDYELTSLRLGYVSKSPQHAMSMARDDSYGIEVRLDGATWLLYIKPREQHSHASKTIEGLLAHHGAPTTQVVEELS